MASTLTQTISRECAEWAEQQTILNLVEECPNGRFLFKNLNKHL